MEKLNITLLTLCLWLALGYGEKLCPFGSEEISVPDDVDCSAFSAFSARDQSSGYSAAAASAGHVPRSRVGRSVRHFFWDGFPFPPGMSMRNPLFGDLSRWLRGRPRPRPRPRPPADDIEECPDEGIKFISHPTNCEKYILCVDGEEMATLTCPDNMHFSRELRSCTNRREAGCEDFEFVCPEEDTPGEIVFLPNEDDCTMYYLCWSGTEVPLSCAPGLHWSVNENMCLPPELAQCEFGFALPMPAMASIQCPRIGIHQLPQPGNCEGFILCVNGNGVERDCPNGFHFSPELSNCVPPDIAGCDKWACPANSNQITFVPNTEDCGRYYICLQGGNQIERECANGMHWSTATNACMSPDEANCEFGASVECPPTGIHQLPDPDNCEDYWICVNGNEISRTCPEGLHFSPHLSTCAPPDMAGCDSWSCPANSNEISFIPNTEDCTRYYICLAGNQIERECGSGMHWSITSNMCMKPEDANCEFGEPFECPETGVHQLPHPDNCDDYFLCINGLELKRSCPNDLHFSPHLGSCAPPEVAGCDSWSCPADSTDVSFIPNTEDCTRYYICLAGNQIERECGSGMHWSIANNMCMNPNVADCPFGEPFECPDTGIHQLPNPDDCEKFFLCVNGEEVKRTCPAGLHFSPHLEICTSPEAAGCEGWKCPADSNEISFIPNIEDCSSYFICLGGNEIEMTCAPGLHWSIADNACMDPDDANCPFGEPFECPETGVHQLPNPDDCEKFFLCVNGDEFDRSCPGNLHFSPHLGICTDPAVAGCDGWECPADSTEVTFIPNTEDCRAYFICFFGTKMPMQCGAGQHWSIAESTCMNANLANCPFDQPRAMPFEVTAAADCPATGIVSVPNPESCEDYYLCVNGMAVPRQCAAGLHFSRTLAMCVPEEVAECVLDGCPPGDLGFLPNEEDCNMYYLCFGGNKFPMQCPGDLHWSVDTNSCMDPLEAGCKDFDEVIECPATGIENIPYPGDCERFILCVNGFEIPLQCAPGLHFSPTARTCMPPEEAGCDDDKHVWQCPAEDTPGVIVFIPNTEDCNRYYLCWAGQQISLACAPGLHWSIEQNRCMDPDDAECPWRDDDPEVETCPEEGVIAIADPESCEHYILCVNGAEVPRACPPGMHFSREIRHCAHPLVANCVLPSLKVAISTTSSDDACPKIAIESEMMFMRNSKDCQSYYLCTKDESVLFSCADGLAWNADKRKCMLESKANCSTQ